MNLAVALLVLGGGAAIAWAGIADPPGGLMTQVGRVLRGEPIQKKPSPLDSILGGLLAGGAAAAGINKSGFIVTTTGGSASGGGTQATSSAGAAVVAEANTWLGIPYLWGGKTRSGVDCSGLTWAVYRAATGLDIGTWTGPQMAAGTSITQAEAAPGDLVFWGAPPGSHVGIVIGGGQMIHAPHTGDVVKVAAYGPSTAGGPMTFRRYVNTKAASA